jgi:hypothetical protein
VRRTSMNKIRYAVLELAHSLVQATPLKTVSPNYFVCCAVQAAGEALDQGKPGIYSVEAQKVRAAIRASLGAHNVLESWLRARRDSGFDAEADDAEPRLRATRLAWIKWMMDNWCWEQA